MAERIGRLRSSRKHFRYKALRVVVRPVAYRLHSLAAQESQTASLVGLPFLQVGRIGSLIGWRDRAPARQPWAGLTTLGAIIGRE